MSVRYTETALREIDEILAYIAARNPDAASRISERIDQLVSHLRDFPLLGHAVDEAGVRIIPLGRYPYLIFYTPVGDDVVILHVRHGARERP
jgi:toxin ParE1/3/4